MRRLCKAPDGCEAVDVVARVKCCLIGPMLRETGSGERVDDRCQRCGHVVAQQPVRDAAPVQ